MRDGTFRVVVLGDSVPWGQRLLPEHKYSFLIEQVLTAKHGKAEVQLAATSGAVIGAGWTGSSKPRYSEVPVSFPTIFDQSTAFRDSPETVDAVIVTGGINDVNIRRILNPLTSNQELRMHTRIHCYGSLKMLLEAILKKFTAPTCKVLVSGYYPILSKQSDIFRIGGLLDVFKVCVGTNLNQGPILSKITDLTLQFWTESEKYLARAASELAGQGANVTFVPSPFQTQNAVFASDPWLFGLTSDFEPQDEVIADRHQACKLYFDDAHELASREQCYRASAGHPNVEGARQIAAALLKHL